MFKTLPRLEKMKIKKKKKRTGLGFSKQFHT
jgi:hypothetical protein